MAVIGSYNGASIIALPATPAPKQVQLTACNTVAAPTNPFTGGTLQVLSWPGADYWTAQVSLPKLLRSQAPIWAAFLAEVRGRANVFLLGDPSYRGPQGVVRGSPVVNGSQTPMATTVLTRGWTANSFRLLLPGDYIQLGVVSTSTGATAAPRLHRVLSIVNSDANGDAAISIFPSLRDPLVDGQAVILNVPVGLFRMADNKQSMTTDETRLSAYAFNVTEAR